MDEILTSSRDRHHKLEENSLEELIYDLNSITNILQEIFVFIQNGYIEDRIHILTRILEIGNSQNKIIKSFDDLIKELQNS